MSLHSLPMPNGVVLCVVHGTFLLDAATEMSSIPKFVTLPSPPRLVRDWIFFNHGLAMVDYHQSRELPPQLLTLYVLSEVGALWLPYRLVSVVMKQNLHFQRSHVHITTLGLDIQPCLSTEMDRRCTQMIEYPSAMLGDASALVYRSSQEPDMI